MIIDFYCPHQIELLFDFFSKLNIKTNEIYTDDKKKTVLKNIDEMLTHKVLIVGEIYEGEFIEWNLSNDEVISKIDHLWKKNTSFPDFYKMVWFGYKDWYLEAMRKKGFGKEKIIWKDFIENNIGDLKKWLEENKPKN